MSIDFEKLDGIQREVARKVVMKDHLPEVKLIGGVDQAFFADKIISFIVVLDYFSLEVVDFGYAIEDVKFPYIPGYLFFREAPAIYKAFKKLRLTPDILIVDGCGVNHPRKAGLASHLGVEMDLPTIGVSKSLLSGEAKSNPVREGEHSYVECNGEITAALLLSKSKCRPIVIARGHRVSLGSAIKIIKHCLRGYKQPEPLRLSHYFANYIKRNMRSI